MRFTIILAKICAPCALFASLLPSDAVAAEVIYRFKGTVTAREATGTNNLPLAYSVSDPAIGDVFELSVRFEIPKVADTTSYGVGTVATYISPAITTMKVGSWSLENNQENLFKARISVSDNASVVAPPNNTLYYPADSFRFSLSDNFDALGYSPCPTGIFANISEICYQSFLTTSGWDVDGKTLKSPALDGLNIGIFSANTISLSVVDFNFQFRRLTIGNLIQSSEPVDVVPEPASWIMMILGMSVIGGMLRYKRKSGNQIAFM